MRDPKREEGTQPAEGSLAEEAVPQEMPKPPEDAKEPLFPLPKMESIELGLPPADEPER